MREIKFRAWHNGHDHAAAQMIYDSKPGDCLVWKSQGQNIEAIMQHTGIKDRNGKEHYFDDIINIYYGKRLDETKVISDIEQLGYLLYEMYEFGASIEIIGNIYEDPELAKRYV